MEGGIGKRSGVRDKGGRFDRIAWPGVNALYVFRFSGERLETSVLIVSVEGGKLFQPTKLCASTPSVPAKVRLSFASSHGPKPAPRCLPS